MAKGPDLLLIIIPLLLGFIMLYGWGRKSPLFEKSGEGRGERIKMILPDLFSDVSAGAKE